MSTPNKDIEKVEVRIKWDPSETGEPANDLDIIAATYGTEAPYGSPVYLVHFDSRSPDGTITLNRDSRTGQGYGFDEVMTLELDRLSDAYARVVVGVAIQQRDGRKTFGHIENTAVQVREGYTNLAEDDFSAVADATAAVVAEFVRDASGSWGFIPAVRGFDSDPGSFAAVMGNHSD
ncbi:TerD family protein [Streptomyces sp. NBC_01341]|uniref:TerD family protein n=1 Tax=Streptomyces sp. NBC_01341 TaxID=2903831 RepID=UPI002E15F467|nr:TerD family protein [Streptomyces sp. NBC_01341]